MIAEVRGQIAEVKIPRLPIVFEAMVSYLFNLTSNLAYCGGGLCWSPLPW